MGNRFSHLAGHTALDVINTVDWRLNPDRAIEQLVTCDDVIAWAAEAKFLDEAEATALRQESDAHPVVAARERDAFIDLRECAYRALIERSEPDIARLAELHREAIADAHLERQDHAWEWVDDEVTLATPRHRLTRALIGLMQDDVVQWLSQCADDECGWIYLDTSPRHNRRWCEASGCGDRNRARAYYKRKTSPSET